MEGCEKPPRAKVGVVIRGIRQRGDSKRRQLCGGMSLQGARALRRVALRARDVQRSSAQWARALGSSSFDAGGTRPLTAASRRRDCDTRPGARRRISAIRRDDGTWSTSVGRAIATQSRSLPRTSGQGHQRAMSSYQSGDGQDDAGRVAESSNAMVEPKKSRAARVRTFIVRHWQHAVETAKHYWLEAAPRWHFEHDRRAGWAPSSCGST